MNQPEAIELAVQRLQGADLVQGGLKSGSLGHVKFRPVRIKGQRMVQISTYDGHKTDVRNFKGAPLADELRRIISEPFRSLFVKTEVEELRIQVSRKGVSHATAKRVAAEALPDLEHDRTITRSLPEGEPDPFLQAIGLMTSDGRIRAERRRKYQQINEFIKVATETADLTRLGKPPLLIVDFGCGNAYLTFGLHHYLNAKLGVPCELVGVDRTAEAIERNRGLASALGSETIHFHSGAIEAYEPPRDPDIVIALHACDTATDDALAKAVRHGAKLIFSAPCCHHNLQAQMDRGATGEVHAAILRDGILKERLGDIVTDALRAALLRIAGYRVDVIEFTATEHTPRNLMIRAVKAPKVDSARLVREYRALKEGFGVTPYLERLMPESVRVAVG